MEQRPGIFCGTDGVFDLGLEIRQRFGRGFTRKKLSLEINPGACGKHRLAIKTHHKRIGAVGIDIKRHIALGAANHLDRNRDRRSGEFFR